MSSDPTPDPSQIQDDPFGYIRFHELARRLRAECPWDIQQTHQSLVPYLIEETYEVVDAIAQYRSDDTTADAELVEELGDLLYQIEFHAAIAEQEGRFSIADVTAGINDKLVRRHPHVFGDTAVDSTDEISSNWEAIKRAEKPERTSVLDGIAGSLPSLSLAREVQRKAARTGFDWSTPTESATKVREELDEVLSELDVPSDSENSSDGAVADEIGDLLFAIVNLARQVDVDPESALRAATHKFSDRFRSVEHDAATEGISLAELAPDDLLARWHDAKVARPNETATAGE